MDCPVAELEVAEVAVGVGVGVGPGVVGGASGGASGGVLFPGGGVDAMEPLVVVGFVGVCGDLLQAATVASRTSARRPKCKTRTEGSRPPYGRRNRLRSQCRAAGPSASVPWSVRAESSLHQLPELHRHAVARRRLVAPVVAGLDRDAIVRGIDRLADHGRFHFAGLTDHHFHDALRHEQRLARERRQNLTDDDRRHDLGVGDRVDAQWRRRRCCGRRFR